MFTSQVPTYVINLRKPERERWAEVIAAEKAVASRLVAEAAVMYAQVPAVAKWGLAKLYRWCGGLYQGEIQAWADALGVSLGTVTMLNCAYELSHLRLPTILGCSAGVRWIEGLGMVHVRTLDWPLPSMADATRLFRFEGGKQPFVSVGFTGMVGVLSAMVPGRFSVTINWAPPAGMLNFDFGPLFFLRDTLEKAGDYETAVKTLRETHISTSVFFTVCGVDKGQACVIERTKRDAVARPLDGASVVQTNHHIADCFARNNEDIREVSPGEEVFSLAGSGERAALLTRALEELPTPCTLDDAAGTLNLPPILNNDTCQQMAFCPRTGAVKVWRKSTPHVASN